MWNNLMGSARWCRARKLITSAWCCARRLGQLYELSDGARVFLGASRASARDRVEFALLEELPANEPKLRVTLLLSVVKFDSFEWAIEKATELGVSSIVPLAAERSEKGLLAAAGETRRTVAKNHPGGSAAIAASAIAGFAAGRSSRRRHFSIAQSSWACFYPSALTRAPLRQVLKNTTVAEVVLAVGPEGGWTDAEVELARAAGFRSASLGHLILRAETAVIAALASLSYALEP